MNCFVLFFQMPSTSLTENPDLKTCTKIKNTNFDVTMTSDRQILTSQPKHAAAGAQKACSHQQQELPPQASACDVTRCAACADVISDRFYLQVSERQWHVRCLTCCECKQVLDTNATSTCYTRNGNIYCKDDYAR